MKNNSKSWWGIVEKIVYLRQNSIIRNTHMRFTGNIDAKMDEKGRVFLPAVFRKVMQREGVERLILRRDVFQKCLVLYPENVWNAQVDAITQRTNMFDSTGRAALRGFVAGAESVSMDSNGRILIPQRYAEIASLDYEVRFIGVDDTIEIWNRQTAIDMLSRTDELAHNLENLMNHAAE